MNFQILLVIFIVIFVFSFVVVIFSCKESKEDKEEKMKKNKEREKYEIDRTEKIKKNENKITNLSIKILNESLKCHAKNSSLCKRTRSEYTSGGMEYFITYYVSLDELALESRKAAERIICGS